jgi:hypothetical protein
MGGMLQFSAKAGDEDALLRGTRLGCLLKIGDGKVFNWLQAAHINGESRRKAFCSRSLS